MPEPVDPGVARVAWSELDQGWPALVLTSADVEVTLTPDKGCDIYSWVDRRTGVDVLFKSPWGVPPRQAPAGVGDSVAAWLERYAGGWQLLCPNGGSASEAPGGVQWGFHGEAALVPWRVVDQGTDRSGAWVELSTRLHRAPLRLWRRIRLADRVLTVEESVTNTSPVPIDFMWSHHPAFGAPFLEEGCRITAPARRLIADDETPGTMLPPASRHDWPLGSTADGSPIDLSVIPGPSSPRSHLAYLTDFTEGWYAIVNPNLGLGVALRWPVETFPHAWFWQEIHSTDGYPWWQQAYVCAIEPASTFPAQGITAARRKGGSLIHLEGGQTRHVEVEAVMFEAVGEVRHVGAGGAVQFEKSGGTR